MTCCKLFLRLYIGLFCNALQASATAPGGDDYENQSLTLPTLIVQDQQLLLKAPQTSSHVIRTFLSVYLEYLNLQGRRGSLVLP